MIQENLLGADFDPSDCAEEVENTLNELEELKTNIEITVLLRYSEQRHQR